MCDPITALTVASGVAGFVGQQQQAKAQASANKRTQALILQNQSLQIQSLQNAEDEDRVKTQESIINNQKAADAARATAAVSAGEAGVSGLSVDALLGDLTLQEAENRNDLMMSQDFRQRQRQLDREGIGITSQSQVNQMPTPQYPSFFEAALSTAASGVNTYQIGKARQTAKKSTK